MNAFVLALRQVRYENTAFWRNPVAAFFVFVFPLMILAIFNLLFGNRELNVAGGTTHTATFYVPAIMALSVIYTCFHNVAIGVCYSRERGLLKRTRGTPLPSWAFLFGRIAHAVLLAILLVAIVTGAGVIFYNVDVPSNTLPALAVTLVVGAATFCALALAVTAIIANADASPAVVNGATLPLLFISDVFIPSEGRARVAHGLRGHLPRETPGVGDAHGVQSLRDGRGLRVGPPAGDARLDGSVRCWSRCGSSRGIRGARLGSLRRCRTRWCALPPARAAAGSAPAARSPLGPTPRCCRP